MYVNGVNGYLNKLLLLVVSKGVYYTWPGKLCTLNCRFRWNIVLSLERAQYSHWYRYPKKREWSLASFVVLFRRKSFQISIADETKSAAFADNTNLNIQKWLQAFADRERKEV